MLEPWAEKNGIFGTFENDELAMAIALPLGEERESVVRAVATRLKETADILSGLNSKPTE